MKMTHKGQKFYYADSGNCDKNRVIFFTTEENLRLLTSNNYWYMNGIFDVFLTIFKQVYSIHIILKGSRISMLHALLNKINLLLLNLLSKSEKLNCIIK